MTPTPAPGSPTWTRPLGATGLSVTAVTLGGSPLGSIPRLYGRDVPTDEGVATVRAVLDSPIRALDTSNGYGDGESERRFGAAFAQAGGVPDDVVVMTKVDPRDRDYSADRVRASVDESRERLGMDHLPLVHLHDPENFDFAELTAPGGAVDALVALKESGVIGAIGLAGGRVQEIARYLALGVWDVLLVHNRWTLLDRSAADLLDEAVGRGMGILNAAVYGGGILAAPGSSTTYGYRQAPPEVLDAVAAMQRACAEHGTDLRTAALQFSLRDDRFASTIVGMSRPDRVQATVDAASAALPEAIWDELEALLPPQRVWLDAPFDR
ncbi:aldo/keto reductase [Cellulomonas sp. ATA003]|uniref:aldo/keto reductase n=1 Tax=Cellulomonas sp. ATA003 TaxID=3073064 RepID=UPI002872FD33|nr:aldo/keto reductase [Cellulomonas sp. ATA003]WNB86641.1 aldo/keto reductase [Cellulomonas sp. ATA003]